MKTEKLNEGCSTDVKILFGSNPGRRTYIRMEFGLRFQNYTLGVRQPCRNDDATRRVAHEIGRDQRVWNEFDSPAFPSRAQHACGRHDSSRRIQQATASDGVRQLR
jgi:hypothetical protein